MSYWRPELLEGILFIFVEGQRKAEQYREWHQAFRVFVPDAKRERTHFDRNRDRQRYRSNPEKRGKNSAYAKSERRKELDRIRHARNYQLRKAADASV